MGLDAPQVIIAYIIKYITKAIFKQFALVVMLFFLAEILVFFYHMSKLMVA
jgi:hypothetical protein